MTYYKLCLKSFCKKQRTLQTNCHRIIQIHLIVHFILSFADHERKALRDGININHRSHNCIVVLQYNSHVLTLFRLEAIQLVN